MTVQQLIDRLSVFPRDMRVVTPGFDESGFDDVETLMPIMVHFTAPLGVPNYSHCGAHEEAKEGDANATPAILISF